MEKGFTLIELLVVVLIIGILAAIALPQYMKTVEKSRSAEAITLLESFIRAEDMFRLSAGNYSSDLASLDVTFPNINEDDTSHQFSTNNFIFSVTLLGNFYVISAYRANNGSRITTGDKAYQIHVSGGSDGTQANLWSSKTGEENTQCTTSICKAIRQNDFFKKYPSHQ